jgi:RNA polymerase sigma-70 factor (ECF subfamily)
VPPADPRERRLAERLVRGDESALQEVYKEYSSAVFGLAVRVLANESLAEDVTQEVFVRLWERPERFDADRGSLRSFVLAMAHSRAVERVRSEEARRRRHMHESQQQPVFADPDPAGMLADRATAQAVRKALVDLPHPERLPIELAYFGGMSYRQVAEHLGEPVGTIKYRIRCGMQKMRAALRAVEVSP